MQHQWYSDEHSCLPRFILWPNTRLIPENAPCALENNIYSVIGRKMWVFMDDWMWGLKEKSSHSKMVSWEPEAQAKGSSSCQGSSKPDALHTFPSHPFWQRRKFSHSVMSDSETPWTATCQASLSITNSQSLLKLMAIESVMPSNHPLSHPLLPPYKGGKWGPKKLSNLPKVTQLVSGSIGT